MFSLSFKETVLNVDVYPTSSLKFCTTTHEVGGLLKFDLPIDDIMSTFHLQESQSKRYIILKRTFN